MVGRRVLARHPAYEELVNKVLARFTDPARQAQASTAEQIADVVYEAATDGKSQVRYVAGPDAVASYAQRLAVGPEAFRAAVDKLFFS